MNNMIDKNRWVSTVLTIAGSDSSGGAGIQADIKTISALGKYAASAITALTAQNTLGVQSVYEVSPEFLFEQCQSVFEDLNVASVKIGMLHSREIIEVVSRVLEKYQPKQVVLDPVMISKSGAELLKLETINFLKDRLFPLVSLITPNIYEAEKLVHQPIHTYEDMQTEAKKLSEQYCLNVLIKGGHLESSDKHFSRDVLCFKNTLDYCWFESERIHTENTHGTGCTLSSAIAANLAKGYGLKEAVEYSKQYLTKALKAGSNLKFGHGCGPVDHFHSV